MYTVRLMQKSKNKIMKNYKTRYENKILQDKVCIPYKRKMTVRRGVHRQKKRSDGPAQRAPPKSISEVPTRAQIIRAFILYKT